MGLTREREIAKAAGERFYTTDEPCRRGHLSKRSTTTGACCACASENSLKCQAAAPEHPARIAARAAGERHYARGQPCKHGHEDRWFTANGQCVRCSIEHCKAWNARNPGHMAAGARRRRAADPTRHRAEVKRWIAANKEKVREALGAWKEANRDHVLAKGRVYANTHNARKHGNGGTFTAEDVTQLRESQGGLCAACRRSGIKLEVDHIVPVAKGGLNAPPNLQLLCRSCNASKGDRGFLEWAKSKGYAS